MLMGACKCLLKERRNPGSDGHTLLTQIYRGAVDTTVCHDLKDRFAVGDYEFELFAGPTLSDFIFTGTHILVQ